MNFKTQFELDDYQYLMQAIDETRNIAGDYVEIGVSWGSSARIALNFMQKLDLQRRCYFLDTFDGFNYAAATESTDYYWKGDGNAWGTEARAQEILFPYAVSGKLSVNIIKTNIITDPLPSEITAIAIANIDVDMLGAVRCAAQKIHPLLARGGVMILEDAGHTPLLYGARAAANEFSALYGDQYFKLYVSSGQALFIKR